MKTFILIVNYNSERWIEKCLSSIKKANLIDNAIVIDNASTDKSVGIIESNFPEVEIIKLDDNLGFGQANNIGLKIIFEKGADFAFLMNQDVYIEMSTINSLVNVYKDNQEYGILSPIHLNGKGDALDFSFSNYIVPNLCKKLYSDIIVNNIERKVYELPFVNAAAWLVSRKCIEIVGGFDPIFYHYGEDDNYCQRVLFHGLKIGVVKGTFIRHDREDRKNRVFSKGSNEDWLLKERKYKVNLANILEPDKMHIIQKKIQKKIIFSMFKLNIKEAYYFFKELKFLKRIYPDILKSRIENATVGNHYI